MLNIFPQTLCSGDMYLIPLVFKNSDGTVRSLVGRTLGLTIKLVPEDSDDTKATFWQNIIGDATGKATFMILGLAPGNYWMDVKIWTTGTFPSDRQTIIPPLQMKVIQSVTTRVA